MPGKCTGRWELRKAANLGTQARESIAAAQATDPDSKFDGPHGLKENDVHGNRTVVGGYEIAPGLRAERYHIEDGAHSAQE